MLLAKPRAQQKAETDVEQSYWNHYEQGEQNMPAQRHGTLSLDELMQGDSAQNVGPQLKME